MARHLSADALVLRGGIAELTLLSRRQMSAVGLLVAAAAVMVSASTGHMTLAGLDGADS
jgi:hypothetical protein